MLGEKNSVLGKLQAVPLQGTFLGPKNSPLRQAVPGSKNLILGPEDRSRLIVLEQATSNIFSMRSIVFCNNWIR